MDRRSALTLIYVDGNPVNLPEENVKIDEETGVGIAFVLYYGMAGTVHYNVYRSENSGKTWLLVVEDFMTASAVVTLDGGRSWGYVDNVEGMEKYDFLQGYRSDL